MISLSSFLLERSGRMEDLLLSMDAQLRLYFWTLREINAIRYAAQLQNATRNQIRISHYKKRWRDRYISPDSKSLNFEDPLKMMDKLVNNCNTYQHVVAYKQILSHIVEDPNPVCVEQVIHKRSQNILKSINRFDADFI